MLRRYTIVLGVLPLVFSGVGVARAASYTITDLGPFQGAPPAMPWLSTTTARPSALPTTPGPSPEPSFTRGAHGSTSAPPSTTAAWVLPSKPRTPRGLTTAGRCVAGPRKALAQVGDSFIWQSGLGYTNIGTQPGVANGFLNRTTDGGNTLPNCWCSSGITSTGHIVGSYYCSTGQLATYLYNGNSTSEVTTPAAGGVASAYAQCVSEAGVVIGHYWQPGNPDPVGNGFYNDGTCHVIPNGTYPIFIAGNNIVGSSYVTGDAFVYTIGGSSATDIGKLSGDTSTPPRA